MSETGESARTLADRLHMGAGFAESERPHVLDLLASLERHLARWEPEQVELEIRVKDRGGPEQKVTIEAWLPGLPAIVAMAADQDLDHAVVAARKELIRQIEDEKEKRAGHNGHATRYGSA